MKLILPLLEAGAAVATPLAIMADSFIARGVSSSINYSYMVLYDGIQLAYNFTGEEKYLSWYRGQIDQLILDDGTIEGWDYEKYSLDNYRMGNNLLFFYETTGEKKYKDAAFIIREQINRHPRTVTGGFWHRNPEYPNQMWLDGIFMADSFYAKFTKAFDNGNTTAWDDIALQYDNIEAHTRNATSGLLVHGYDESKAAVWADPVTGGAPLVWNRADGWYFMSLLEVIPVWPETHPARETLIGYFTTLATALLRTQDESGGWWLIMSEPYIGAQGNYIESSGSAMFTYGFLKGIRFGLLDSDKYLAAALKGYDLLASEFVTENNDGTISVPLAVNDYKGAGPFMYASWEIEAL
ncbi:cell wall glycosyl hydrolase YteR [Xylaria bambusicola]|uniref:cell wall glycosyl hydrolase YteR n=1 Tax=Xylaria bambusicola TaxID=326684 RepID=UPI002007E917|nr:cell wall glycosyl hydrolase YteR [Xylaria bambusicola]KAI0526289.1 cell wall glycosyl hydrolase YteR [Xylaria bambusicola]